MGSSHWFDSKAMFLGAVRKAKFLKFKWNLSCKTFFMCWEPSEVVECETKSKISTPSKANKKTKTWFLNAAGFFQSLFWCHFKRCRITKQAAFSQFLSKSLSMCLPTIEWYGWLVQLKPCSANWPMATLTVTGSNPIRHQNYFAHGLRIVGP